MAKQTMQVGTKGLTLRVKVVDQAGAAVPLSGAPEFYFEGPTGVDLNHTGTIDPADDTVAVYVLQTGDGVGEVAGTWRYQVLLDLDSGWNGYTELGSFEALHNLAG